VGWFVAGFVAGVAIGALAEISTIRSPWVSC
jgi:hypothetical protein